MTMLKRINPAFWVALGAVLVVGAGIWLYPSSSTRTVTAEFPRAISLYEGSAVKILGIDVGEVKTVEPIGTKVRVTFTYDDKYKVPRDAKAVVVSPSIVGDRFIQLTPAYTSGPVLPDGARLGLDRTATPLELDEIFSSINDLTVALGPEGINRPDETGVGALTRILDSTARNFQGQGVQFNQTLRNLSKLTKTLSNNKDEFFSTLAEVENFTSTLAENDDVVRRFNDSLASGANLLADERQELAAVIQNLSTALTEVRTFVGDNRELLTSNIRELNTLSKVLVKNRDALDETLRAAPIALNNLALAYNETTGTLDVRANVGETLNQLSSRPSVVLCALIPDACGPLTNLLRGLGIKGRAAPGVDLTAMERAGLSRADLGLVGQQTPNDPTMAGLVAVQ